jgi:hypothetical protein
MLLSIFLVCNNQPRFNAEDDDFALVFMFMLGGFTQLSPVLDHANNTIVRQYCRSQGFKSLACSATSPARKNRTRWWWVNEL